MIIDLIEMGKRAKQAAFILAQLPSKEKNHALSLIADQLESQSDKILFANQQDIERARVNGISEAVLDRLLLTPERIKGIADDVRHVISLPNLIGRIVDGGVLDSGVRLERVLVPLGVVGTIYEARPNVTIDVASLCLKTGNAVILRGGKETRATNEVLLEVVQDALLEAGLPRDSIQSITDPNRDLVIQLLKLDKYVDMIIPRGGAGLHQLCKENSTIPVIIGGIGVCHIFVEESADLGRSLQIIENAKMQRPSTCNTLETLLVQKNIAEMFLPSLVKHFNGRINFHVDEQALAIIERVGGKATLVQDSELRNEWLSLDLNIMIVDDIHQAIHHISEYGSQHSDAILTESQRLAQQFVNQVDSAAVYVNASTRFTDGSQFGLGAEVAVSTQKLHARGPMGLEALTTYKWIGRGDYTSRA